LQSLIYSLNSYCTIRVNLQSELVQGDVEIAVRPSLPIEGVHLLLGNNLAGGRVWRDILPPVIVKNVPSIADDCDVHGQNVSVFTACAVTRAMSRAVDDVSQTREFKSVLVPNLPPSLSHSDFVAAQKEDETLMICFLGCYHLRSCTMQQGVILFRTGC